jgi:hypothetical protein
MNKTSLILTLGLAAFAMNARATLLFQENFNYTAPGAFGGNVNPGSGVAWTPGNSGMTVSSSSLSYAGLQTSGNSLSMAWGSSGAATNGFANVTSGSIYYSFLLNVSTVSGANDYLTALNPSTGAKPLPNGSTDAIDAYLNSNGTIGLRTAGASEASVSGALTLGTTYLVVLEYNFTTATASLFLDPTAGGAQPTASATIGGGTVTSINDIGFKSQATTGNFLIGDLMVGTTWADVTPAAVPEPSVMAFAGLGLAGFALIRNRRH